MYKESELKDKGRRRSNKGSRREQRKKQKKDLSSSLPLPLPTLCVMLFDPLLPLLCLEMRVSELVCSSKRRGVNTFRSGRVSSVSTVSPLLCTEHEGGLHVQLPDRSKD
mmetsp:Transcript_34549/g.68315  ORF Transcript_34549/g.68315 Transcript_34549/m.68315 type:complete len:109 (-) Transcript_34549:646-972(-)